MADNKEDAQNENIDHEPKTAGEFLMEKYYNMVNYLKEKQAQHPENQGIKVAVENLSSLKQTWDVIVFVIKYLMEDFWHQATQKDIDDNIKKDPESDLTINDWVFDRDALDEMSRRVKQRAIQELLRQGKVDESSAESLRTSEMPDEVKSKLYDYFELFCNIVHSAKEEAVTNCAKLNDNPLQSFIKK